MSCGQCGVLIKHSTHFHRHVKRCGVQQHRVKCLHSEKTFTRNDALKRHLKKAQPESVAKVFAVKNVKNHSSMS